MESPKALRTPADFQAAVIINTASTRARHVQRQVIDPLMDSPWGQHLLIIKTVDPTQDNNAELIKAALKPHHLAISSGGDGLGNDVIQALAEDEPSDEEQIPVLFLPFGNGNDLARAIAGMNILRGDRLTDTLARGNVRKLGTLAVTDSNDRVIKGGGWLGIGVTALASEKLNSKTYRQIKKWAPMPGKLIDMVYLSVLAQLHQQFKYEADGQVLMAHELIWNELPTMAKFLQYETDAFSDHLLHNVIDEQNALGGLALRCLDGLLQPGGWRIRGQQVTQSEIELVEETRIQIGGETHKVPAGRLHIAHKPKTLTVLTQPSINSYKEAA